MISIQQVCNNLTRVDLFNITIWTSYRTVVAFRANDELCVSRNYWSNTTGKHLKNIDGGSAAAKKQRLSEDAFIDKWGELIEPIFDRCQLETVTTMSGTNFEQIRELAKRRRRKISRIKPKENEAC